jgi:hypothetical protein
VVRGAITVLLVLAVGVAIGKFSVQPVARAQTGCSAASLKGAYSMAVNGLFYDADGFQGVYASAGLTVADGAGGITGTDTLNLDGTPTRARQLTGVYSINPDCTGTMNVKDTSGNVINMDLVVANGGKDVVLVDYDADMILNGTAKQQ